MQEKNQMSELIYLSIIGVSIIVSLIAYFSIVAGYRYGDKLYDYYNMIMLIKMLIVIANICVAVAVALFARWEWLRLQPS